MDSRSILHFRKEQPDLKNHIQMEICFKVSSGLNFKLILEHLESFTEMDSVDSARFQII